MTEDSVHGPEASVATEPAVDHAAFVCDVYVAVLDRSPSPEEIGEQSAHLMAGMPPYQFLAALLQSEERGTVLATREGLRTRGVASAEDRLHFVTQAYRGVLGREADDDGLATHLALLEGGTPPSVLLALLGGTVEAASREERLLRREFNMEVFVRTTFEAILHRVPEETAVTYFSGTLRESMDIEGFVKGLYDSDEGRALRGGGVAVPLNAACVNLTMLLESLLRDRGMVLDLGPPKPADLPLHAAERLLQKLARTIQVLSNDGVRLGGERNSP